MKDRGEARMDSGVREPGFAATRWSLVAGASGRERAPLAELCARYWYPVYAYVRRAGHPLTTAQAIVQGFFQHLFEHRLATLQQQRPSSFREWLLLELSAHIARDPPLDRDRVVPALAPPLSAEQYEQRHLVESSDGAGPETGFRRSFAIETLGRAHARLREEAVEAGHARMFDELVSYLTQDPPPGQYEVCARTLGASPLALVIAVRRLRQRFRELCDEELVDTIDRPEDLAVERAALFSVLGGANG